jgi:hypothetical protein
MEIYSYPFEEFPTLAFRVAMRDALIYLKEKHGFEIEERWREIDETNVATKGDLRVYGYIDKREKYGVLRFDRRERYNPKGISSLILEKHVQYVGGKRELDLDAANAEIRKYLLVNREDYEHLIFDYEINRAAFYNSFLKEFHYLEQFYPQVLENGDYTPFMSKKPG